jgi:hypothetical protein
VRRAGARTRRRWSTRSRTAWADLTVYGAKNELHSGHYGNWAPNPALSLARLLVSMKGADDRVLVDGFTRHRAADRDRAAAITDAPPIERALMEELWLGGRQRAGGRWPSS